MLELRPFLEGLEAEGDLVRIRDKVSTQYEIVGLTRQSSDQGGPALLFENVEGSSFPVLSGLFGTQRRVAKALGLEEKELFARYVEREGKMIEPKLVERSACQEVVWKGADVDLAKLPILRHYEKDGGPYVTAGLQIAKDPATGYRNVSIHRMLPLGKDRLTVFAAQGRHLRTIIERNEEQGRGTPIATAIGCSPAAQIGSQA